MSTADKIIAAAYNVQRLRPSLTASDWRLLGLIIDRGQEGISYTELRTMGKEIGTIRKLVASIDRLADARLIDKNQSGGSTSPLTFTRSSTPLEAIIL